MSGAEWAAVLGAAATFITSLTGLIVALQNRTRIEKVHRLVDGQMTALVETARKSGQLDGERLAELRARSRDQLPPA